MASASRSREAAQNPRPIPDTPDKLQDLCIFYCMNNLDILAASLNNFSGSDADETSAFSPLLGNKMLDYFLRCCVPSKEDRSYIDQLLQTSQLCNSVSVKRRDILTAENIEELAHNPIKRFELMCFDSTLPEYRYLVENNLTNLVSLSLSQKGEENNLLGYLNLLCGKKFYSDSDDSDDLGEDSSQEGCQGDPNDPSSVFMKLIANTKFYGFHIQTVKQLAASDDTRAAGDSQLEPKTVVPNLRNFSYEQVYTMLHPNIQPSRSFGWFIELFCKILESSPQLQSFSLSSLLCNPIEWFLSQPKLTSLTNLESLCLVFEYIEYSADVDDMQLPYTEDFFTNLPLLKNLRHLDISSNALESEEMSEDAYIYTERQVEQFIQAVKEMPHLKYIDISFTNLCSIVGHGDKRTVQCEIEKHCMPGFEGRHFEFLGLYGSDACRHKFIPAERVSGNINTEQFLAAVWTLNLNKEAMSRVLEDLLVWVKAQRLVARHGLPLIDGLLKYLEVIAEWEPSYTESETYEVKNICQVFTCLYFVLKDDIVKNYVTIQQKRQLLEQILVKLDCLSKGCWRISASDIQNQIVRVGLLLVLILDLEKTAVYSYRFEQYVRTLVAVYESPAKQSQKELALRLLHSACRVSQENKVVIGGKLGLIEKLLLIIREKMGRGEQVDDIMEKVWSIIWTLTDEVSVNCELLVRHGGCPLVKSCIERYQDAKSLHRKISGAMNNVSENANLIPHLMTSDLVGLFRGMLTYFDEDDYDVSSHAAGFLIMLAAHGPRAWTVPDHSRDEILAEVDEIMKKWDINKPKGVKFRSLTPMLTQIENHSTPVAQVWGAWLICNLIIVKPQRYCDMLESENGLQRIRQVLQYPVLREDVVTLLEKILTLTLDYKALRAVEGQFSDDD